MRTRALALITIFLLLYSCAGGPALRDEAPDWFKAPPQKSDSQHAFRGIGEGETLVTARLLAIEDVTEAVLDEMSLGDPENWDSEGRSAVKEFTDRLSQAIRNPDSTSMDGMVVARRDGWYSSTDTITYAVDILWDKEAFKAWNNLLSDATAIAGPEFGKFEERARAAEENGNVYEAAFLWAAAAGVAEKESNTAAYRLALKGIESAMSLIDYEVLSVPAEAFEGLRPSEAVIFNVSAGGKPTVEAEFVITYPRAARDGSPIRGEARMVSDEEGNLRFLPPEIAFAGTQDVTIAPSSRPFLEYLDEPDDRYIDEFILSLETPAAEAEFEALTRIRTLSMGILILETDLTGNPLDSNAAAGGLLDDLLADGFEVEIMDLDPREMIERSNLALIRDIKADERFASRYERILHARVALEDFQQDGDSFTVRVSGELLMSDIERQVTLYRTEVTKSSRAASSQQAMSAAFRQLGRSFAEELIALAP